MLKIINPSAATMQYATALLGLLLCLAFSSVSPIAEYAATSANTDLQVVDTMSFDNPADLPTSDLDLTKRWSDVSYKKGSEMLSGQWTTCIQKWCTQMISLTVSKGKSLSMALGGATLSNGSPGEFIGTYHNDHAQDWTVVYEDCTNLMGQIVGHCSQGGWYGIKDKGTVQVTATGI